MHIIGIAGKAGSGKSTIATHLVERHRFAKHAFAERLKWQARSMGWDGKKDERGRRLLQHLGDVGREYDLDCWIRPLLEAIRDTGVSVVIDDVRYENEVRALLELGATIIFVDRPHNTQALVGDAAAHSSEGLTWPQVVELERAVNNRLSSKITRTFCNDADVDYLTMQADHLLVDMIEYRAEKGGQQ